ncbi:MAG: RnfABCDGE type electron transport complex subunit D [Candidatus Lernaella stagnicola]|nr:RnfABCDGE type electron transport complex subunit D [Candidatus Lernaella stagnicola]
MSDARRLIVSSSPHVHGPDSVPKIMWSVVAALVPATALSIYTFGLGAALTVLWAVAGCVMAEALFARLLKRPLTITDGSAAVTGLLLALNLPANAPWWMTLIGCLVAVGLAKWAFGGLGQNIFNPALVARVFLLISFPVQMTSWPLPMGAGRFRSLDALTGATPLGRINEAILRDKPEMLDGMASWTDMALGNIPGSMGEISAVALMIGALFLLYRGYITWHTPVSYIGTVFVLGHLLHLTKPELFPSGQVHVMAGGLMLGALFMATDMVTSPLTGKGQLIFGLGCGVLTVVIRLFGAYPEGVSFAILIMNATVPLIDRFTVPKKFGYVPPQKEEVGAVG